VSTLRQSSLVLTYLQRLIPSAMRLYCNAFRLNSASVERYGHCYDHISAAERSLSSSGNISRLELIWELASLKDRYSTRYYLPFTAVQFVTSYKHIMYSIISTTMIRSSISPCVSTTHRPGCRYLPAALTTSDADIFKTAYSSTLISQKPTNYEQWNQPCHQYRSLVSIFSCRKK